MVLVDTGMGPRVATTGKLAANLPAAGLQQRWQALPKDKRPGRLQDQRKISDVGIRITDYGG
jgi:hypothetical protein